MSGSLDATEGGSLSRDRAEANKSVVLTTAVQMRAIIHPWLFSVEAMAASSLDLGVLTSHDIDY